MASIPNVTTRTGKGSTLTTAELDANFTNLRQAVFDLNAEVSTNASAAGVSTQSLTAVSTAALHRSPNTITNLFVYDTTTDSDGGAWTTKCQHTSWHNEPINDKWLGPHRFELDARTANATLGVDLTTSNTELASAWTPYSNNIVTQDGAFVKITYVDNVYGAAIRLVAPADNGTLSSNMIFGRTYVLKFQAKVNSGLVNCLLLDGSGSNITLRDIGSISFTDVSLSFVCGNYSQIPALRLTNLGTNQIFWIGNFSLQEVTSFNNLTNSYFQSAIDGKFYKLWKNLLSYSEDLANNYWTKSNVSISSFSGTYATNSLRAETVEDTSNSAVGRVSKYLGSTVSEAVCTLSVRFRKTTGLPTVFPAISLSTQNGINGATAVLNTTAGTAIVGTSNYGGFNSNVIPTISVTSDNDYWILSISAISPGDGGFNTVNIAPAYNTDGTAIANVAALGSVVISGIQIEKGLTLTSYERKIVDGTISETFRGNKRDFPKQVAIVAEATNVTLYDLTENNRPMWMRFSGNSAKPGLLNWAVPNSSSTGFSVFMLNGILATGETSERGRGVLINFARDDVKLASLSSSFVLLDQYRKISNRNAIPSSGPYVINEGASGTNGYIIAGNSINSVVMVTLPDAWIDKLTGLAIPTIYFSTSSGVTRVKHDNTSSSTAAVGWPGVSTTLHLDGDYIVNAAQNDASYTAIGGWPLNKDLPTAIAGNLVPGSSWEQWSVAGIPGNLYRQAVSKRIYAIGIQSSQSDIVNYQYRDFANPRRGLEAFIAANYNTGFQVGDNKRTYLSDTDTRPVYGVELLANNTFDFNVSNWSPFNGASISWSNKTAIVTSAAADTTGVLQNITCEIGKIYKFELTVTLGTASIIDAAVTLVDSNVAVGTTYLYMTSGGTYIGYFAATTTQYSVKLMSRGSGNTAIFDNISVKEVVVDRGVKEKYISTVGTLNKTAVAIGAQLLGYSGWNAGSNAVYFDGNGDYLSVPSNAAFTINSSGDFTIESWFYLTAMPSSNWAAIGTTWPNTGTFMNRWAINFFNNKLTWFNSVGGIGVADSIDIELNKWIHVAVVRIGSTVTMYKNGVSIGNQSGAQDFSLEGSLFIGGLPGGPYITGYISNFRIVKGYGIYSGNFTPTGPLVAVTGTSILTCQDTTIKDNSTNNFIITANGNSAVNSSLYLFPNYLRESYSSDLDFGTGEWSISAWVNIPTTFSDLNFPFISNNLYITQSFEVQDANGSVSTWDSATRTLSITNKGIAGNGYPIIGINLGLNTAKFYEVEARLTGSAGVEFWRIGVSLGWANVIGYVSSDGYVKLRGFPGTTDSGNLFLFCGNQSNIPCTITIASLSVRELGSVELISRSHITGSSFNLGLTPQNKLSFNVFDGTTTRTVTTVASYNTAIWLKTEAIYKAGRLALLVNGSEVASTVGAPLLTLNNSNAVLTIGNSYNLDAAFPGSLALIKLSATAPTAEQSEYAYNQEKQMFRENSQVCLPNASVISDLAYDSITDRWIVNSSSIRSYWTGLVRNNTVSVSEGTFTKVSYNGGIEISARGSANLGVDVTIPALSIRDEFSKRSENIAKLAKNLISFDFIGGFTGNITNGSYSITGVSNLSIPTNYINARISAAGIPANTTIIAVSGSTIYLSAAATATTTGVQVSFVDFLLPSGYEAKVVNIAGIAKQEGTTKDFVRLSDNFKEIIRFNTAPSHNAAIQIQASRSSS